MREVFACEVDDDAVQCLLRNAQPDCVLRDVGAGSAALGCLRLCHRPTSGPAEEQDRHLPGRLPLAKEFHMNPHRFSQDPVDSPEAAVLLHILTLIDKQSPKIFLLENVAGVMKKRGGPANTEQTVLQWVEAQVAQRLPGYSYFSLEVGSAPLCLRASNLQL